MDLPALRQDKVPIENKSKMSDCRILVGTSGYSFQDWIGPFYPEGIQKGKMLDYYKEHFPAVEINSTYYRIPHPSVFYHMANKVPQDFEFIVKTHSSFTHDPKKANEHFGPFFEAVAPLIEAGKLKGYLAQFPWSFRYSAERLKYIIDSRNRFGNIPLFVEFRNGDWNRAEVFRSLKENDIGFCCVDEPPLAGLFPALAIATTAIGYVRFHGRNSQDWWQPQPGSDRYNYTYKREELADWIKKIDGMRNETEKIYLFFNNCHLGQAVRSAKMMMEMMQLEF